MTTNLFSQCVDTLATAKKEQFYSLPKLAQALNIELKRLPVSIRIVLESLMRNADGTRVLAKDVEALANWKAKATREEEVPFVVSRVILQDFTGVPLVVDLAAMRDAVAKLGQKPSLVQPLVPVDLVIDHSVQVDYARTSDAIDLNQKLEFQRNKSRYQFLKWGMGAFQDFSIVPPGIGIVHQVNLEYLARSVIVKNGVAFPDTLVGTDSHTTMINGLGIVGWGVGGIEAEAAMLGQPTYFLMPDVIGVHLKGKLKEGVTATDLVLRVTELLRKENVVGQFVEFHGEGAAKLPLAERATIANMAPEYGATMGYFPIDEEVCRYLAQTGRSAEQVSLVRDYYQAQQLFGIPQASECDYTRVLELDLATIEPSVAGPKRPQDRIALSELSDTFTKLLTQTGPNGYGKEGYATATDERLLELRDGDVVIAAITSCTNTSNPGVMLAAGLLAKKANERGLSVHPKVKTSLAPGSRVVTQYLEQTGLMKELDSLGFNLVGYGCTTCIGNSGPLDSKIEKLIVDNKLVTASVLSGNRNFEARVHQNVRANFLMSPPLVVAFAIAGRVNIDMSKEPLGVDKEGKPVMLSDIWPTMSEIYALMASAQNPETFHKMYRDLANQNPLWKAVEAPSGEQYGWDSKSTYIQHPPYFDGFSTTPSAKTAIKDARVLAVFGGSVTTDHISPAGEIAEKSPAGQFLIAHGEGPTDFNSYGSRRGNHEVMIRGTFANVRIKNLLLDGVEGGYTIHQPSGEKLSIFDAAMRYQQTKTPLVIFAGKEYGTGSSRDWAAKGTQLLGVRLVVAQSFERIHRSNLIGMGVLPCQFIGNQSAADLKLDGTETISVEGLEGEITPRQEITLSIQRKNGQTDKTKVLTRIDTPIEVEYYKHGGILPYVLRQLLA